MASSYTGPPGFATYTPSDVVRTLAHMGDGGAKLLRYVNAKPDSAEADAASKEWIWSVITLPIVFTVLAIVAILLLFCCTNTRKPRGKVCAACHCFCSCCFEGYCGCFPNKDTATPKAIAEDDAETRRSLRAPTWKRAILGVALLGAIFGAGIPAFVAAHRFAPSIESIYDTSLLHRMSGDLDTVVGKLDTLVGKVDEWNHAFDLEGQCAIALNTTKVHAMLESTRSTIDKLDENVSQKAGKYVHRYANVAQGTLLAFLIVCILILCVYVVALAAATFRPHFARKTLCCVLSCLPCVAFVALLLLALVTSLFAGLSTVTADACVNLPVFLHKLSERGGHGAASCVAQMKDNGAGPVHVPPPKCPCTDAWNPGFAQFYMDPTDGCGSPAHTKACGDQPYPTIAFVFHWVDTFQTELKKVGDKTIIIPNVPGIKNCAGQGDKTINFHGLEGAMADTVTALDAIEGDLSCISFNHWYASIFFEGLCTDFTGAAYGIWTATLAFGCLMVFILFYRWLCWPYTEEYLLMGYGDGLAGGDFPALISPNAAQGMATINTESRRGV